LYRITFVLGHEPYEQPLIRRALQTLLMALTTIDADYLKVHPEVSDLSSGPVRSELRPSYPLDWHDIPSSLERKIVGPVALACWRAAERRVRQKENVWPEVDKVLPLLATPLRITIVLNLFNGPHERDLSHAALKALLVALTAIDVDCLRAHPELLPIYDSGVHYQEEPIGQEDWLDVPSCLKLKANDCEDLACWRAAELQVRHGLNAWPTFTRKIRPNGGYLYHIIVMHPDGRVECPSRRLGMR